jgi:hypothetical protein
MLHPISRLEELRRDVVIRRAEGDAFDELAGIYGVARPVDYQIVGWREGLVAVAYGPRGTPGATFAFLLGALRQLETRIEVTTAAGQPTRLTAATPGSFTQEHIGRLVQLDPQDPWEQFPTGQIYRIEGPADIATSGGDWVELTPLATTMWDKPELPDGSWLARILAFCVREPTPGPLWFADPAYPYGSSPGDACKVFVCAFSDVVFTPATYWQSDGAARPVGQPYGGQIQDDYFEPGDPLGAGPHPPYLIGDTTLANVRNVLDLLLAAGVEAIIAPEYELSL